MTSCVAIFSVIRRKFEMICANENGATAIEYALIASGISIAIVATVVAVGGNVTGLFQVVAAAI